MHKSTASFSSKKSFLKSYFFVLGRWFRTHLNSLIIKAKFVDKPQWKFGPMCVFPTLSEPYFYERCFQSSLISDISHHGTIIQTGKTCKEIPCYMRDPASRWFILAYPKSGTWDPGLLVEPETRDPVPIFWMRPGTSEPRPKRWDTTPATRDATDRWDLGSEIRDPKSWTLLYLFIFNLFNADKLTYIFDIWR